jgi:PIN domain nuclease of toxin-antitoxin system
VTTLLLDTHVALWMAAGDARIGPGTRELIADPANDVVLSVASVWEAEVKRRLGKLDAPDELWDELEASGVDIIAIERDDAVDAAALPPHHRDPFDRMLVAQAIRRRADLVTVDHWFERYDASTVRASD